MPGGGGRWAWLPGALVVVVGCPGPVRAQFVLADVPGLELEMTGYVQSVSGAVRGPGALGGEWEGIHGAAARLAWTARLGESIVVEVHDRFLMRVGAGSELGAAGLGVSVVPERSFDLSGEILSGDDYRFWHDLDRLAATVYTRVADVTVGRQAVSWGSATIFPVADLWGRFSPFELDTQQKPGVDAVRALAYPLEGMELDLVVADAGKDAGASAAAHLTLTREWGDLAFGGGKFWDEAILLGGVTWVRETTNLRVEGALPWATDGGRPLDPRVTLGVDRLGVRWTWSAEAHFNGLGAGDADGYLSVLGGAPLARGESYLLGRRYLGGAVAWSPGEEGRLRIALSVLGNMDDGSATVFPAASYDLGQAGRITLGGLVGAGEEPAINDLAGAPFPVIELRSEFGSYGRMGYLQMALYF